MRLALSLVAEYYDNGRLDVWFSPLDVGYRGRFVEPGRNSQATNCVFLGFLVSSFLRFPRYWRRCLLPVMRSVRLHCMVREMLVWRCLQQFFCVLSRVRFRGNRLGLFVTGIGLLTAWCCEIVFWERIGLSHGSTNFWLIHAWWIINGCRHLSISNSGLFFSRSLQV